MNRHCLIGLATAVALELFLPSSARAQYTIAFEQPLVQVYTYTPSHTGTEFLYWMGDGGTVEVSGASFAGCIASARSCQLSTVAGEPLTLTLTQNAGYLDPIRNLRVKYPTPVAPPPPPSPRPVGVEGAWNLLLNDDFGTNGNVRSMTDLESKYTYSDGWNTTGNGENYGARRACTAPANCNVAWGQNIRTDLREITADTLVMHVKPATSTQTTVGPSYLHDALSGSVTSRFKFPATGDWRSKEFVAEVRYRMSKPVRGWWIAPLWAAGSMWHGGAEMDVMESFWTQWLDVETPYIGHGDSVGGSQDLACWLDWFPCTARWKSRGTGLNTDAAQWHTYTWYQDMRSGRYRILWDGVEYATGTLHWTDGGSASGPLINMFFELDGAGWGHTVLAELKNLQISAAEFPLTGEYDYFRIWQR